MKDGEMLGTVLNDAKNQGKAVYSLMDVLARGETPNKDNVGFDISDGKYIWVPYIKVTHGEKGLRNPAGLQYPGLPLQQAGPSRLQYRDHQHQQEAQPGRFKVQ